MCFFDQALKKFIEIPLLCIYRGLSIIVLYQWTFQFQISRLPGNFFELGLSEVLK